MDAYDRIARAHSCPEISTCDVGGDPRRPDDIVATIRGSTMTVLRVSYDMTDDHDLARGLRWAYRVAAIRGVRVYFETGLHRVVTRAER